MRKKLIKNVFCTVIALGMLPAFTGCGGKEKPLTAETVKRRKNYLCSACAANRLQMTWRTTMTLFRSR